MKDELDVRIGDPSNDMDNSDQARARFEANRRYDRRPATENLDRPAMVVTTRTESRTGRVRSTALVSAALIIGVLLLAIGVLIGLLLERPGSETDTREEATIDEVRSSQEGEHGEPVPQRLDAVSSQTAALDLGLAELDLSRISFVPGTAQLTVAGHATISDLALVLLEAPTEPVEILVRTFSGSTPGSNHGLSTEQADTILSELARAGVNPQRVTATGLGSSGSEPPSVAAAVRIEASDDQLAELVLDHGPIVLETPLAGVFSDQTTEHLSSLGGYLEANPVAGISLVGYSWNEDSPEANHDAAHHVLDEAHGLLIASGAAVGQISLVGLGDVTIPLADREAEVVVETGVSAMVGASLSAIELGAVSFEPGSATLTTAGRTALETVAKILTVGASVRVEVAVHTYSETNSQENHDLSQRQGESIINYLTNAGIAPSQLQLVWHGDPAHFATPDSLGAVTFAVVR